MQCPTCNVPLSIADRQGVEIDFCPQCRGVWLDRGELDKIIERAAASLAPAQPAMQPGGLPESRGPDWRGERDEYRGYERRDDDDDDEYYRKYGRRRKKRSFLDDIFDFG